MNYKNSQPIENGKPFVRCGIRQGMDQTEQFFFWRVQKYEWTRPDRSDEKRYVLGFKGWREYQPGERFNPEDGEVVMVPWDELKAYLGEMAEFDRKYRLEMPANALKP